MVENRLQSAIFDEKARDDDPALSSSPVIEPGHGFERPAKHTGTMPNTTSLDTDSPVLSPKLVCLLRLD